MPEGVRTTVTYAGGTVVTSDYLPWARVLGRSFAEHNPGAAFTILVLDEPKPDQLRDGDSFELIGPQDVAIDPVTYQWMATIYDGFELSCALKPWLLRHLLRGADAALYLDSDILVCGSVQPIARRANENGLVLSPHRLEPPPADGLQPDEDTFLRLGQFNGGFLAVGPSAGAFLDWWGQRLVHDCVHHTDADPLRFVDQRWLDLTVNYFEVDVLRDRGANVAYWNLDTRALEHGPRGYTVDGEPLKFIHLSGFDPSAPGRLTTHPARVEADHSPALAQICREYASALVDAGVQPKAGPSQTPTLAGSIVLTPPIKGALRAVLRDAGADTAAPDPRAAADVLAWLHAPVTPRGTSRYLMGLHASHAAVRREFAQVPGDDEPRYQGWAAAQGVAMGLALPAPAQPPAPAAEGPLAATSALLVDIDHAVDVVLEFACEPGEESLAVAVAPERVAALAAQIEAEAERRGVALDADISLVECRDVDELSALLQRADRTIDSGCPLLARAGHESALVHAAADREPLEFLIVNTYPSNPARHGGGMRIQNLWGSLPADICAQAVVLAHTDGGPALMPLTRARPGFEQHVPFWPELRAAIAQLNAVTGTSSDDVALALAATGDDPFTRALRSAIGAGADALVLSHPFMVGQARAAAPHLPIVYEAHNVEADLKASIFRDDEGGHKAIELVTQLEAEACAHARLVVCCTEEDGRRLIELYGVASEIVHVIPNGASVASMVFTPWEMRELTAPRCVFAGSGHAPNVEAAAIIIEAAASLPGVGFDLVGDLAGELGHLSLPANVRLHDRVSDVHKQWLFAQAALALNPMKVGSGSNLKLVDYLATGLPVLSSTVGARGFGPELVDCLEVVAPEPAALADAIGQSLERDWSTSTAKARDIVQREYDWRVISARYAELLHNTLGAGVSAAEAA
ncbi:MAG TPA: glycosyltransferase [Solirubrobacteraceae bacterium]|nr:glycosyltransferase [Solirubrobacteraceae bacterium]